MCTEWDDCDEGCGVIKKKKNRSEVTVSKWVSQFCESIVEEILGWHQDSSSPGSPALPHAMVQDRGVTAFYKPSRVFSPPYSLSKWVRRRNGDPKVRTPRRSLPWYASRQQVGAPLQVPMPAG